MLEPNFSLDGKLALVTGSSKGLGLAIARGIASSGAKVVLNSRTKSTLDAAVDDLRSHNLGAEGICFDITDTDAVERSVAEIESQFGPISILINNAGVARRGSFADMSFEDWSYVMDINVSGAFLVTKAVVPGMKRRRSGKIINICSLMSSIARRDNANYAASKGAIAMFTKALAVELAGDGITANGIAPGFFDTPLTEPLVTDSDFSRWLTTRTPMGRWGKPEELMGTAVFLASEASGFITGQIIYVDGGMTAAI